MYPHHFEGATRVNVPVTAVFEHVDGHSRLSSHMNKPSWRMGWGRMTLELDEGKGRRIGSRIRLGGRVFGLELFVEEIVTERIPPARKAWETTGTPRLLVIGRYRMGFEVTPRGGDSELRVFIDYALPDAGVSRWLGLLLGAYYARWCVRQMLDDTVRFFERTPARNSSGRGI